MRPTMFTRITMLTMIVVAVIGAVDAAVGESWDLVVLLGSLAVLAAVLLAGTLGRRPLVPIRADLVRWMAGRVATSGERIEDLADRAIAAYRAGLVSEEHTDASPPR